MLQRIHLNHASAPRQHNPLGIGLLLIGGIAAVAVFLVLQQLGAREAALEADMLHLRQPQAGRAIRLDGKENAALREETAAAQAVLNALALPWQPLFTALERLNLPEVRLLAVEPNPERRKVRITAEAASVGDMLDYVGSLGEVPMFGDVFLMSHEHETGAAMPFRFVVEAAWQF